MGSRIQFGRLVCLSLAAFALSCADSSGPVFVDAQWNLTCPDDTAVACGSLAPETCLGSVGQRAIVGSVGEASCTGAPIVASCEAIDRSDGRRLVFIDASIDGEFAFQLTGATIDTGSGSMEQSACNVTIIEDGLPYDVGACGTETPSMEQPCQISNINTEANEVVFDLECRSLISSTTDNGFDVTALGGGPTTIRFANCSGF